MSELCNLSSFKMNYFVSLLNRNLNFISKIWSFFHTIIVLSVTLYPQYTPDVMQNWNIVNFSCDSSQDCSRNITQIIFKIPAVFFFRNTQEVLRRISPRTSLRGFPAFFQKFRLGFRLAYHRGIFGQAKKSYFSRSFTRHLLEFSLECFVLQVFSRSYWQYLSENCIHKCFLNLSLQLYSSWHNPQIFLRGNVAFRSFSRGVHVRISLRSLSEFLPAFSNSFFFSMALCEVLPGFPFNISHGYPN